MLRAVDQNPTSKLFRMILTVTPNDYFSQAVRNEISLLLGITKPAEEVLASLAGEAFLRVLTVSTLTGLTIQAIDREMAKERFPRSISLGPGVRVRRLTEVKKWQEDRIAERDAAAIEHSVAQFQSEVA